MFKEVSEDYINKLYKVFGVLNFILSVFFLLLGDAGLAEKIFGFISINICFIMFYFFFKMIENYKGKGNLAWPLFGGLFKFIFGFMSMVISIFAVYMFVNRTIKSGEINHIFFIGIAVSILLGGLSLLANYHRRN
ncbi:hypothetical protein [Winogradskyella poriferorum]|uniref:Uncharacterized protein n=1 Tax=Winogradskyella poriferorum TaxID=307627 RepID=A0ABU7W5M8_9FLAO